MFIINIELKRGRARKSERNADARIVRGPDEVDVSRRDGRAFGERWLEFGRTRLGSGTWLSIRTSTARGARCWWSRAGSRSRSGRTPRTGRSGTASIGSSRSGARSSGSPRSTSSAGGRRSRSSGGIAEERLRRRCAEEGADYGVCGAADPDGAAPTPELAEFRSAAIRLRLRAVTDATLVLLALLTLAPLLWFWTVVRAVVLEFRRLLDGMRDDYRERMHGVEGLERELRAIRQRLESRERSEDRLDQDLARALTDVQRAVDTLSRPRLRSSNARHVAHLLAEIRDELRKIQAHREESKASTADEPQEQEDGSDSTATQGQTESAVPSSDDP